MAGPLDPCLRRDDGFGTFTSIRVIPAKAGILTFNPISPVSLWQGHRAAGYGALNEEARESMERND